MTIGIRDFSTLIDQLGFKNLEWEKVPIQSDARTTEIFISKRFDNQESAEKITQNIIKKLKLEASAINILPSRTLAGKVRIAVSDIFKFEKALIDHFKDDTPNAEVTGVLNFLRKLCRSSWSGLDLNFCLKLKKTFRPLDPETLIEIIPIRNNQYILAAYNSCIKIHPIKNYFELKGCQIITDDDIKLILNKIEEYNQLCVELDNK